AFLPVHFCRSVSVNADRLHPADRCAAALSETPPLTDSFRTAFRHLSAVPCPLTPQSIHFGTAAARALYNSHSFLPLLAHTLPLLLPRECSRHSLLCAPELPLFVLPGCTHQYPYYINRSSFRSMSFSSSGSA